MIFLRFFSVWWSGVFAGGFGEIEREERGVLVVILWWDLKQPYFRVGEM